MLSNGYNGSSVLQFSTRPSVIKVARSRCSEKDASMKYEVKLKNDIQLTHQNYMKIEQENSYLSLRIDDLESRLRDHNYQYACLKYELEQLNKQKCDLICKINVIPVSQSDNQFQVDYKSNKKLTQKIKLPIESTYHAADIQKLPETFCVCGVQLKSEQILNDHLRYHKSKGKFICKICGIKTNGLNLLKHHMKRMHAVKEFSPSKGCRTCGKMFSTLRQLHDHRRREQ